MAMGIRRGVLKGSHFFVKEVLEFFIEEHL